MNTIFTPMWIAGITYTLDRQFFVLLVAITAEKVEAYAPMPTAVRTRSARNLPSAPSASSPSSSPSRPGVSARKLSSREARHLTGRPMRRAA